MLTIRSPYAAPVPPSPLPARRPQPLHPVAVVGTPEPELDSLSLQALTPHDDGQGPQLSKVHRLIAALPLAASVVTGVVSMVPGTAAAAPLLPDFTISKTLSDLQGQTTTAQARPQGGMAQSAAAASAAVKGGASASQQVKLVDLEQRAMRLGDTGDAVLELQRALSHLYPGVTATGTFDEATAKAVSKLQASNHLKPSGMLTSKTAATLFNKLFWEKGYAMELNQAALRKLPKHVRIEVDQKRQRADLINADTGEVLRSYPVSTGQAKFPTPTGSFKITQISEKPTWYPPDSVWVKDHTPVPPGPDNPLGPAMMRLGSTSVLFHGVPANEWSTIGKARASHGCMRMFPQDAWELHDIVQRGVQVDISAP